MKLKKIAILMFIISILGILVLAGYRINNERMKELDSLGIVTEASRQYVSRDQTQCAATTWVCNEGMQQFYDETGCGCEPAELSKELRQYVSRDQTQCAATTWVCNGGMQQFYDETGCGCESKTSSA